jgi:hypothetical protein
VIIYVQNSNSRRGKKIKNGKGIMEFFGSFVTKPCPRLYMFKIQRVDGERKLKMGKGSWNFLVLASRMIW